MYRITEQTDHRLHIRYQRSWGLGVLFILIGLLVVALSGWSYELQLKRVDGQRVDCVIRKSLFGLVSNSQTFTNLQGARVVDNRSRDRDSGRTSVTYRVLLETASGEHPVTSYAEGNYQRQEALCNAILAFLDHPSETGQTLALPMRWWVFMALLFPLGGIYALRASGAEVLLDRTADSVSLRRDKLIGRDQLEFPLSEVSSFAVRSKRSLRNSRRSGFHTGGALIHVTVMVLRDGTEVALRHIRESGGLERRQQLANRLNRFLRSPNLAQGATPPTSAPVPATGKTCRICGADCSAGERLQDPHGHYYHRGCYEAQYGPLN